MANNEGKKGRKKEISRRDFIKGTGLVVGGAAISSSVLAVACGKKDGGTTENPPVSTENKTQTPTAGTPPTGGTPPAGGTPPTPPQQIAPVSELTNLTVNGAKVSQKVEDNETLAHLLRVKLGLTGTKVSCDEGICGFCTVIYNGKSVSACTVLAKECEGANVITVESMDDTLYLVQRGFLEEHGFQCGFCLSGQIMAATALLMKNPNPTRDEVKLAMSGNLCLCSGYELIANSVMTAAKKLQAGVKRPVPPPSQYKTASGGGA